MQRLGLASNSAAQVEPPLMERVGCSPHALTQQHRPSDLYRPALPHRCGASVARPGHCRELPQPLNLLQRLAEAICRVARDRLTHSTILVGADCVLKHVLLHRPRLRASHCALHPVSVIQCIRQTSPKRNFSGYDATPPIPHPPKCTKPTLPQPLSNPHKQSLSFPKFGKI